MEEQSQCVVGRLISVTAVIAVGKRPVPFRTRKLSLPAPMVLPSEGGGRVGRSRTHLNRRAPHHMVWGSSHTRTRLPGPRIGRAQRRQRPQTHRGWQKGTEIGGKNTNLGPRMPTSRKSVQECQPRRRGGAGEARGRERWEEGIPEA